MSLFWKKNEKEYKIITVCADILTRYGVAIPYHILHNCFLGITRPYRQAHASQQLFAPEAEHVLVDWIHFYLDTSHPLSRRTICKKAKCICGKRPSAGWICFFLAWWLEIKLGKPSGLDPKRARLTQDPNHMFSGALVLRLQTIKTIVNSRRFEGSGSDEPRRVQVLHLYCLTRFESEGSGRGDVY